MAAGLVVILAAGRIFQERDRPLLERAKRILPALHWGSLQYMWLNDRLMLARDPGDPAGPIRIHVDTGAIETGKPGSYLDLDARPDDLYDLSPDARQEAYFQRPASPAMLERIAHWLPFLHYSSAGRTQLWISRRHADQERMLGYLDPGPPSSAKSDGPTHLHWTPEGKHLSFVYRDALYTVPAE